VARRRKIAEPIEAPRPLVEGVDYYVDQGLYVWTAAYLARRGTCCGSGCRHCPYPKGGPAGAVGSGREPK
jgi:hypothetical protein